MQYLVNFLSINTIDVLVLGRTVYALFGWRCSNTHNYYQTYFGRRTVRHDLLQASTSGALQSICYQPLGRKHLRGNLSEHALTIDVLAIDYSCFSNVTMDADSNNTPHCVSIYIVPVQKLALSKRSLRYCLTTIKRYNNFWVFCC